MKKVFSIGIEYGDNGGWYDDVLDACNALAKDFGGSKRALAELVRASPLYKGTARKRTKPVAPSWSRRTRKPRGA